MDALALATMSMRPKVAGDKDRERAGKVAEQFESIFVRSMVSSLRQTSGVGDGGMFGDGPGADTYADWFDQNLAEQIGRSGNVGIKQQLMNDFARAHAIGGTEVDKAVAQARTAAATADRQSLNAVADRKGGFDVLR